MKLGLRSRPLQYLAYGLLGLGIGLMASGVRFFSFLAQQISHPFSLENSLTGIAQSLHQFERALDSWLWLAPLLVVLGMRLRLIGGLNRRTELPPTTTSIKSFVNNRSGVPSYQIPTPQIVTNQIPTKKSVQNPKWGWRDGVALGLVLVLGLVRLYMLNVGGLTIKADYDEGVYSMAAQLTLQGFAPYRDFFFAQPPMALYGLFPAVWLGGSGEGLLWWGRFTSIVWASGSGWLIYLIGKQLANAMVGWIAVVVMGLDGITSFIGHQVMLEFQVNFFSLLAIWAFLKHESIYRKTPRNFLSSEKPKGQPAWWLGLAGIAIAAAFLSKLNGVLVGVAIFGYLLVFRRWADALKLTFVAIIATVVLFIPVIWRGGLVVIRQVIFFQTIRDGDGVAMPERVDSFTLNPQAYLISTNSSLTVLVGLVGLIGWLFYFWHGGKAKPLLIVAFWGSLTLLFFTFSRSFFVHYYVMFVPILAIAAGGIAGYGGLFRAATRSRLIAVSISSVVIGLVLLPAFVKQASTLTDSGYSPAPQAFSQFIETNTPPDAKVQTFDMLQNILARRALPRTNDGTFLIDSYGSLIYKAAQIENKSWLELVRLSLSGDKGVSSDQTLRNASAVQNYLSNLYAQADMVVLDERGRDYTAETTLSALKAYSVELISNTILGAYANQERGARAVARWWIATHLPRGAKVWVEPGAVYLTGTFEGQAGVNTWQHPPEWYAANGYQYMLLSSEYYGTFYRQPAKSAVPVAAYNQLMQGKQHLATFRAGSDDYQPQPPTTEAGRLDLISLISAVPMLNLEAKSGNFEFEGALRLHSYALPTEFQAEKILPIALRWERLAKEGVNLKDVSLFIHLLDQTGEKIAQLDTALAEGNFRAESWQPAQSIIMSGDVVLPSNLPLGEYRVVLGLYYPATGQRLSVTNGRIDGAIDLGVVRIGARS